MSEPLILAVETSSRMGSVAIATGARMVSEAAFSSPLRHSAEIFPAVADLLDRFDRTPGQIEQVYLSGGPGSFTGLRIAATLAKTMHLANAAKIVMVDTLDVVAANAVRLAPARGRLTEVSGPNAEVGGPKSDFCLPSSDVCPLPAGCDKIAAVLDAKRGQFFIAVYERSTDGARESQDGGIWRKAAPDALMTVSEFLTRFACREKPIWLLGDGLVYYKDRFEADGVSFLDEEYWSPRASKVHLLGWQRALNGQFIDPMMLTPNYLRQPDVTLKRR